MLLLYLEEDVDQWSGAVLYGSDTAVSEISDWKRKKTIYDWKNEDVSDLFD